MLKKYGSRKNVIIILVILLVAGFGVYKLFFASGKSQSQTTTQQVARGTIIASVSASGQISSANSIPVDTQLSGVVTDVYVKNGDNVEAGKPIAKIEPDQNSTQRQTSAYATYMTALNQLKTAQDAKLTADATMWTDQKALLDAQNNVNYKNNNTTNPTTKKDYTDLEKQSLESTLTQAQKSFSASEQKYKDADAAIAAAQANMSSAYLSYQQTLNTITAPISGTVNGLTLRKGMALTSSSTGSNAQSSTSNATGTTASSNNSSSNASSQKVAVIQTQTIPAVTVNASEVDATRIKENQKATITLDALPGKTFTAHVMSIDTTGTVSSGVTTYPVVLELDSEAANIYPNMAATANIITDTKDNVLTVPSSAIQTQNGISTVRVMKNGQVQQVQVETGISSDSETEITSGLSEGDVIVTSMASGNTAGGGAASPFGANPFRGGFGGGGGVRRGN